MQGGERKYHKRGRLSSGGETPRTATQKTRKSRSNKIALAEQEKIRKASKMSIHGFL